MRKLTKSIRIKLQWELKLKDIRINRMEYHKKKSFKSL